MESNLENLILSGQFDQLRAIYFNTNFEEFTNALLAQAFENESLSNYSVILYLLLESEDEKLHDLAYQILSQPLCHIEGAYASSLYHAQKAVELTHYTNVQRLENLLLLNIVPEKIVSDAQAKSIAKQILTLDPTNKVAKETLN